MPGVAQGAIQSGTYAAKVIRRRVLGRPYEPFHYRDKGDVAVIGRLEEPKPPELAPLDPDAVAGSPTPMRAATRRLLVP